MSERRRDWSLSLIWKEESNIFFSLPFLSFLSNFHHEEFILSFASFLSLSLRFILVSVSISSPPLLSFLRNVILKKKIVQDIICLTLLNSLFFVFYFWSLPFSFGTMVVPSLGNETGLKHFDYHSRTMTSSKVEDAKPRPWIPKKISSHIDYYLFFICSDIVNYQHFAYKFWFS